MIPISAQKYVSRIKLNLSSYLADEDEACHLYEDI